MTQQVSKEEVRQTLDYLVNLKDTEQVNKWINILQTAVDVGLEFTLTGESAYLDVLCRLRRESMNKYIMLLSAVDRDRTSRGLGKVSDRRGKTGYSANYMPTYRKRQTEFMNAWNEQYSESERIKGPARIKFMALHAKRWGDEKRKREDAARHALGRSLTKAESDAIGELVNEAIAEEIAELKAFIRDEIRKPLSQRNPNGFPFKLGKT